MKVPKAFQDGSVFNKFKSKCSDRVFESEPPPSIAVVKKEEPERYLFIKFYLQFCHIFYVVCVL